MTLIIITVTSIFIFISLNAAVYAENGDGSGGGNSQKQDAALTLEGSSVADKSIDVSLNPTIQLNFNKYEDFEEFRAG